MFFSLHDFSSLVLRLAVIGAYVKMWNSWGAEAIYQIAICFSFLIVCMCVTIELFSQT